MSLTPSTTVADPWWNPRRKLAALVIGQLCVACLMAMVSSYNGNTPSSTGLRVLVETSVLGAFGLLLGQEALLACWGAFSNQRWYFHIPRFVGLGAWFLLSIFLGNYLYGGAVAKTLVEEISGLSLLVLLPLLIAFVAGRLITGRRFARAESGHYTNVKPYQFNISNLLLVMAEISTLLALGRLVLRWNRRWAEEFWNSLHLGNWDEWLILAAALLTVIPVVFVGLAKGRRRLWHGLLLLYLLLWSFGTTWVLTWVHFSSFSYPSSSSEWWTVYLLEIPPAAAFHFGAAYTILFSFWILRHIGYDFRRRDEEGGGRGSSNARNSSASNSA